MSRRTARFTTNPKQDLQLDTRGGVVADRTGKARIPGPIVVGESSPYLNEGLAVNDVEAQRCYASGRLSGDYAGGGCRRIQGLNCPCRVYRLGGSIAVGGKV